MKQKQKNELGLSAKDETAEPDNTNTFSNGEKRYQWPPPRDPNLNYKEKTRHPITSIITALPILMLVGGLYFYYHKESVQNSGAPIEAQSTSLVAEFKGLSETRGRHYLWLEFEGASRGIRVKEHQVVSLEAMTRDANVSVKMAPTVAGSTTLWALKVQQGDTVYLDGP